MIELYFEIGQQIVSNQEKQGWEKSVVEQMSILNKSKIKEEFGIMVPYYKDSLDECLKLIGKRG
jgi:hypothetical protein